MKSFKVALLQILPEKTVEGNLKKGLEYCRKAKNMGADLALFPEMWSSGYNMPENEEKLKNSAIPTDGEFVNAFASLARELNMAIGVTYLESYEPAPRNTLCIIDRFGNKVMTYAKVHTCDFEIESKLTSGEDFYVAALNTEQGIIKIGAMICYDREFPESARILMLKGAEVILVPNACPMEINRLSQLRARAFENMVGVATCNYPGEQPDCNGHSSAFDGILHMTDSRTARDMLIVEAGEREGIYLADFPVDELRAYRKREIFGNAYRHPQKYKMLVEERIEEPFVRADYRNGGNHMVIRKYQPSDCKELTELFYNTIHSVNAKDYTEEQLNVWATGKVDLEKWNESLSEHYTVVAVEDGKITGFGDIDETGYLDRLYVHKDYQKRGIAAAICNELEAAVDASEFTTYASITARPFFERRGYQVVRENQVERQGICLTNYLMKKSVELD